MKLAVSALIVFVAAALVLPSLAAGQEPVKSFDQLNTRLKAGDTIWVTDSQGREIEGKLSRLSPASLQLTTDGDVEELPAERVGTIRVQPADRLRNGVLWGALVGFVGGALSCGVNPQCTGDEGGAGMAAGLGILGAAAGAGIGALIDAAVKGPKLTVYRASGTAGDAHFSIAPVITPRAKGVAVSFAF